MKTEEMLVFSEEMPAEIKGWQDKATEKSYLSVKEFFTRFLMHMQQALKKEEESYHGLLSREEAAHSDKLAEIKRNYLDAMNSRADREYEKTVGDYTESWNGTEGELTVKSAQIKALDFEFVSDGFFDKMIGVAKTRSDRQTMEGFEEQKKAAAELAAAVGFSLEAVRTAAGKVRDAKKRLNFCVYEDAKKAENSAYSQRVEKIEAEHRNRKEELFNRYNAQFSKYFNSTTFNGVWANVQVFMKSDENYSYSKAVPRNLYFGKRSFTVKAEEEFYPEVINMVKGISFRGVEATAGKIRITLPFFRSIEEGYSVCLETEEAATAANDSALKNYVWKILMNFTAGQTIPLLLDFDITTALTEFREIGESSGNRMITKPWSDGSDIERELVKLALEHTNLTTSYSDDISSRMEREPVYFVAARNFPKGFSREAVESLAKVFTAGSAKGFFGMVHINGTEMASKKNDAGFNVLVDSVRRSSLCIRERNGGYIICGNGDDDFEFGQVTDEPERLRSIKTEIISGVRKYSRKIEKFEHLFSKDAGNSERTDTHDINTWYLGDATSVFEVPLGISGASNVQKLTVRSTAQHALISGITGSGKSSLLRTMIVAAMMKYTPEHVNFYLIDFKEGVEFEIFNRYKLPWIKAIALNTQRVFAYEILRFIQAEFQERANAMNRHGVNAVCKIPGNTFPRIVLVFDEIQELLRIDDEITEKCINILAMLVSEGRAMNINIIIASQNFAVCRGMDVLKANMAIRIALKGAPESTQVIMGEDFNCSQLEKGGDGYGAINDASGESGYTNFFSGGYLGEEELCDMLSKFEATMKHRRTDTRIMSIYIDRDRENKFNRFIGSSEVIPNKRPSDYEMVLGDEFLIGKKREYFISREKGENLAVIGKEEEVARSVFACAILSAFYGELASSAKNIRNELVRLIDLSDEYEKDADYFTFMSSLFTRQISRAGLSDSEEMIVDTYNNLMDRMNGRTDSTERLFFMIFGIDSIMSLRKEKPAVEGDITVREKLIRILQDGPEYGINCIFWARSLSIFRKLIGDDVIQDEFSKRIFFGQRQEEAEFVLCSDDDVSLIKGKTVFYKDTDKATASAFRVYETPERSWVRKLHEVYEKYNPQV